MVTTHRILNLLKTGQLQFVNDYPFLPSGERSSCHAVTKCESKFSVTREGSKGQAETSITGMSLSELSPPHSLKWHPKLQICLHVHMFDKYYLFPSR